jgi:hypothetical protein
VKPEGRKEGCRRIGGVASVGRKENAAGTGVRIKSTQRAKKKEREGGKVKKRKAGKVRARRKKGGREGAKGREREREREEISSRCSGPVAESAFAAQKHNLRTVAPR